MKKDTADSALQSNTNGFRNTAAGVGALESDAFGFSNTAIGAAALWNATGQGNIGVGAFCGRQSFATSSATSPNCGTLFGSISFL
jgi:hypothetical protein